MLYSADKDPPFRDAAEKVENNLHYFSGPKLEQVARGKAKEWGTKIKFDRSRTHIKKYEMLENEDYVKIKRYPWKQKAICINQKRGQTL